MLEFYGRAGFRVATTPGAHWYVPGRRFWKSFPCAAPVDPAPGDLAALARAEGVLGVEYFNDRGAGVRTGLWTLRDARYSLDSLQRQHRRHVERGLERAAVREIAFDELAHAGLEANRQWLARTRHDDPHLADPARWRALCDAGARTSGAFAFATLDVAGRAEAYLVGFVAGPVAYGLVSKSLDAARATGANHALYFAYAQAMIRRPGIEAVTLGLQTLPAQPGVERMKRHAGFSLEGVDLALVLRPAFRAIVSSGAARLAVRAGERLFGPTPAVRRVGALQALLRASA